MVLRHISTLNTRLYIGFKQKLCAATRVQKADVTPVLSRLCHGQAGCSLLADPRALAIADCLDLHVYMKTTYTCVDSSVFLPQHLLKPHPNQLNPYEGEEERMTTTSTTTTTRRTTTTTTTTQRTTTTTTEKTSRKPVTIMRQRPDIDWWGSEGLKRGGAGGRSREQEEEEMEEEQEQADSIYRGGVWLEGVSRTAYPPKVERTSGGDGLAATAVERLPEIVSGVVMNYSFVKVCTAVQLKIF
jgi:hypothetical protein